MAHGFNRGSRVKKGLSPGGAKENDRHHNPVVPDGTHPVFAPRPTNESVDYLDGSFLSAFSPFLAWRARPAFSSFSLSSLLILARSFLSSFLSLLVSYFSSNSWRSLRCSSVSL